jgi:hypothetical protein
MGTYGVQIKGVLPWLVRWARRAGTRDFYIALAALVSPVQNMFFLTVHQFNVCVPIAQQPGQAVVRGRLSLNACLWARPFRKRTSKEGHNFDEARIGSD